jgi:hypothetical protein
VAALAAGLAMPAGAQQKDTVAKDARKTDAVTKDAPGARPPLSFSKDVMPIIARHCMPCHEEEQSNPSELSLDSYELLMKGGKHGDAVVPGDSSKSTLVTKLGADPPFGDRMPLDPRRKRKKEPMKPLADEEISTITEWVRQGAKDN